MQLIPSKGKYLHFKEKQSVAGSDIPLLCITGILVPELNKHYQV